MGKTDKEVLELCKTWFEDIMERSDRLTTGNVAHGSRAIRGVAKNYAEFVDKHLQDRWKPTKEQMNALRDINLTGGISYAGQGQELINLYNDLKKLKGE